YNAVHNAAKPTWERLWGASPHTLIHASGAEVGLPDAQMGNSEVGHMHLGAGRIINQDFTRISDAVETGSFADNAVLGQAFEQAATSGNAVHLLGLASPGGVHSHDDQTVALIEMATAYGVSEICVHAFLDGRDTPPKSAAGSLQKLQMACSATGGVARIASLIGRYYAMDRNKSWDRVELAYRMLVDGEAQHVSPDALIALDEAYARGETDEFVTATVIENRRHTRSSIYDGDVVVFSNFRADRARQLTAALVDENFTGFSRARCPELGMFVSMTDYGEQFHVPIAFPPDALTHTFGEILAEHGLRQLRIAETEKYAHVTYFFNGGREAAFPGEDRTLIPSPRVATYDLQPEMNAEALTDALVEAIRSRDYGAIICNYANADMVGHTGNYEATVRCIEVLDECLARVVEACRDVGMELLVTADHGNAETMRTIATKTTRGDMHTAHTSNLVPLIYVGRPARLRDDGGLVDIAPTMLHLMGLPRPTEMTGRSLVELAATDADDVAIKASQAGADVT
ncbi:MAG: 2,3-bisphosphoglycerate-independent phosphoglycerate mutase, partial [Gammaproteobacteria bacterium]|nr:2,3-bisphosphoglycerate-independent phosphoglycerate mutase [Gammaproteobacteria bacterium]